MSCETNVCHLAQKIKSNPYISFQYNCHVSKTIDLKFLPFNINIFDDDNNLNCLGDLIEVPDKVCESCCEVMETKVSIGNIVFVDCQKKDSSAAYHNVTIDNIQQEINAHGLSLSLHGIVHFSPPTRTNGIGHYIALINRRNQKWEAYDDLLKKCVKPPKFVNPALLIYVNNVLTS